ncbi:hypothetical protein [uncultured Novosphingobium sp.]|nr:hypothetical protein [uncultured Novosphingobium sp.]
MPAPFAQAWAALCMGRTGKQVAFELAMVWLAAIAFWFFACLFVLLEPVP